MYEVDDLTLPKPVRGTFPIQITTTIRVVLSLQVLLLAVLLTLWTDIPTKGWQDMLGVTSHFALVLSLTWFKSNKKYHSSQVSSLWQALPGRFQVQLCGGVCWTS